MKKLLSLIVTTSALCACTQTEPVPSKLKQALNIVRGQEACSGKIALEWSPGFPVPLKKRGTLTFKVFFYPVSGNPASGPQVHSPAGETVIDMKTGTPISCHAYTNAPKLLSSRRWPESIASLGMKEFEIKTASLYLKTEDVGQIYASGDSSADAVSKAKEYAKSFRTLAEPDLLSYYYELNPDFWEWLRKTAGNSIPSK